MSKYLLRFENLLLLTYVFFFWGFDLYLLVQGVDTSRYESFYRFHLEVFAVFLLLPVIPYFFYYRLRRKEVRSSAISNFYFPVSLLLIIILTIIMRLEMSIVLLNLTDSHKISGGYYSQSDFTMNLFNGLLIGYLILQIIFILDSFRMIRNSMMMRQDVINNIGKE